MPCFSSFITFSFFSSSTVSFSPLPSSSSYPSSLYVHSSTFFLLHLFVSVLLSLSLPFTLLLLPLIYPPSPLHNPLLRPPSALVPVPVCLLVGRSGHSSIVHR